MQDVLPLTLNHFLIGYSSLSDGLVNVSEKDLNFCTKWKETTSWPICTGNTNPADTDVFKTSSGRLKKFTTSYNQTRRPHDVWKKTLDLRHLEDVWFTSCWRWPIYDVLKTSDLRRLEDAWFMTSWRRLIYVVLKMSNLAHLENVWFTTSSGLQIYSVLKTVSEYPQEASLSESLIKKVADYWLIKKRLRHRCISCGLCKVF